jgi:hypothetical protein
VHLSSSPRRGEIASLAANRTSRLVSHYYGPLGSASPGSDALTMTRILIDLKARDAFLLQWHHGQRPKHVSEEYTCRVDGVRAACLIDEGAVY